MNAVRLLLAAFASLALQARALDVPFGADALRYLAMDADAILRVSEGRTAEVPKEGAAEDIHFEALARATLRGKALDGRRVRLVFPRGVAIAGPELLADAFVFVRNADPRAGNAAHGLPSFYVLAGRMGVVPATPENVEAIQTYPGLKAQVSEALDPLLEWTARHLKSGSPFVQRSVVVDLHEERDDKRAAQQLGALARGREPSLPIRLQAVRALELSQTTAAARELELIRRQSPDDAVKAAAERAISSRAAR